MAAMGFMGRYAHTLDAKGRVFVPAKFRAALDKGCIVCPAFHHTCLWIFTPEDFEALAQHLGGFSLLDRDAAMVESFLFQNAADGEMDAQGRLSFSPEHRKFAGLTKDVVLAGTRNRIEVWDKAAYDQNLPEVDDHFREVIAGLNQRGIRI